MSKFKDVKSTIGRTLAEANSQKVLEKPIIAKKAPKVEHTIDRASKPESQKQVKERKAAVPRANEQLKLVIFYRHQ